MKQRMIIVLLACAALTVSYPSAVRGQVDISASIQINSPSDFYQPLEPYGTWVDVSSYGRCWRPRQVAVDWQPYTDGHWEWTDAGWYWVSDEPWGWACFHYGSWYQDASYGWVWIPGTDWAPAWVTWRYSDDYIGWAPCGPGRSVLAPSFFTFCDVHRFHDHFNSRRDFVVNNTTIINRTKIVNNFNRRSIDFNGRRQTVFENRGPGVEPVQRATGRTFTPRPVRDVIRETRRPENMRGNDGRRDARPEQQRSIDQQRRDNIDQQRRDNTPPPTGRDQQRNYQQPDRNQQTRPTYQTPQLQNRERARQFEQQEQQRQQQEQQRRQELRTPQTPDRRPDAIPPTGRDQQRNYQQPTRPQTPTPTPEQRPNINTPERPAAPAARTPERPLPPTGRDNVRPPQPERREIPPAAREPQQVPKPAAPEQRREVPMPPQRPATPERPLPPTGRQDVRPATPERPAPPAKAPEARPAPPVRATPPAAPGADGRGRDGRDNRDNQ